MLRPPAWARLSIGRTRQSGSPSHGGARSELGHREPVIARFGVGRRRGRGFQSARKCQDREVSFAAELTQLLPQDLPHRENVIAKAARHLELIVEMNQVMNLTRILNPREAAIKHVLDSVLPWRLFEGASHVVDAGTGAGFPGVPLSLVLPETEFSLLDATQKKARFVESAVAEYPCCNHAGD